MTNRPYLPSEHEREAIRQRDEAVRDWRETAIERNEAQMQRDEAVRLLRDVDKVWEPLTGKCDADCDCLIHPVRAFLANFKEDSTND